MFEFLSASPNMPFTVALTIMLLLAALEGAGLVLGFALSSALDSLLPDLDLDLDLHAPDVHAHGLTRFAGWIRLGEVPALVILVIFLCAFGLIGLFVQSLAQDFTAALLPGWLASLAAFALSLPAVRVSAGLVARIMPKDETEAISNESFIGRVATITLGTARIASPAQAKFRDEYGQTHYVMVEPFEGEQDFVTGTEVLIVKQLGSHFAAIKNTYKSLSDS